MNGCIHNLQLMLPHESPIHLKALQSYSNTKYIVRFIHFLIPKRLYTRMNRITFSFLLLKKG